jgi:hypothetical protein
MVTRRTLLWTAAGLTGGLATGCGPDRSPGPAGIAGAPPTGDLLVAATTDGLCVRGADGSIVVPAGPALLPYAGAGLVRAAAGGGSTELVGQDLRAGRVRWRAALRGDLEPRAISVDGRLVALSPPAAGPANGERSPYRPVGRERTTLVVADDGGERVRLDLPGNLEPEAFSADGGRLFVLDYLPPAAPDRYRVRMIDLAGRRLEPLRTRLKSAVPPGAEEEMRGEGRQAVYDPGRQLLFTLYTHQPDHRHTRDRLPGARPGARRVHAFVHTLSLREHWAYCVDLPAPFGERPAARHAIALDAARGQLVVVDAAAGAMAHLDPDALTVTRTVRFKPPAQGAGEAAARFTGDGTLALSTGPEVIRVAPDGREAGRWACASDVRGLIPHPDGARVFVGQDGAVAAADLATGRVRSRTAIPGLVSLRELIPG